MVEIKDDYNILEERADYISYEQINDWTVESGFFLSLVKKVENQGNKLFVGPRGSGKTHLMRYTYNKCVKGQSKPLPIYVSFGQYFKLEPLITKKANAQTIFHVWVLLKIILGILDSIKQISDSEKTTLDLFNSIIFEDVTYEDVIFFINKAEKGIYDSDSISEMVLKKFNISLITTIIKNILRKYKRKRAILLLDDAALTLTPEYLIEFFDVVRSLKTREISIKVSVYPGTTEYGPRFHVGHDAVPVDVWIVGTNNPNDIISKLFEKRFNSSEDSIPQDILKLFMVAAFGIPRAFITMVNTYLEDTSSTNQQKYNRVIDNQTKYLETEYLSLAKKLKQYDDIITIGKNFFDIVVNKTVKVNNSLKKTKQITFGFLKDNNETVLQKRMIRFLVEAGLMYPSGEVSHGQGRKYDRYYPHFIFLLKNKAFSSRSRGFNAAEVLTFLSRKEEKHPIRDELENLLTTDDFNSIKLNLPPCSECRTKRITESQRFCHNCGNELVNESKFYSCLKINIDDVPKITAWRKRRISESTDLKTINDIYSHPQPASELRKARGIGEVKSEDIYTKIKNYVEEFLS